MREVIGKTLVHYQIIAAACVDCFSLYQIGKCSANVGQKRRGRSRVEAAKLLILFVELAEIEPATS